MSGSDPPPAVQQWLDGARRLRAIAQTGLAYSRDGYDLERFREVGLIAERMLADLANVPPTRLRDLYLPERGYPTPKVDVRAGVFRDGRVLLVRETSDGHWALPGGWADEAASPRQNVEREVLEESGYRVRARKLVAVKDRRLHPYRPRRLETVYKLLFLCDLPPDAAPIAEIGSDAGLETSAARFFPVDRLPALSAGRTVAADIEILAAHQHDPALPVYCD